MGGILRAPTLTTFIGLTVDHRGAALPALPRSPDAPQRVPPRDYRHKAWHLEALRPRIRG